MVLTIALSVTTVAAARAAEPAKSADVSAKTCAEICSQGQEIELPTAREKQFFTRCFIRNFCKFGENSRFHFSFPSGLLSPTLMIIRNDMQFKLNSDGVR